MPRKLHLAALALLCIDTLSVGIAVALGFGIEQRWGLWPESAPASSQPTIEFAALTFVATLSFFAANRLYDLDLTFAGHREYAAVVRGAGAAAAVVVIIAFFTGQGVSRSAVPLAGLLAVAFAGGARFLFRRFVFRLRESGHFVSRWLLVGTDEHAAAIAVQLNAPRATGVEVVGFLDDYLPAGTVVIDDLRVLGDPRMVRQVMKAHQVSTLVVIPHAVCWESYRDLLELAAETNDFRIKLAPGLQHLVATGTQMTDSEFLPLVNLAPLRIDGMNALLKRALDYAGSFALLAVLLPVWAACAVAARLDGAGPVLRCQPSLSRNKRRFTLVVFAQPGESASHGRFGQPARKLRRAVAGSRLGKLPNIVNVLRGHMSLVGPRAVPESDSSLDQNWVRNLLLVRPGLTGPAVNRPGGNNVESQTLKDIAYVRNYSLWLDARLLFASVKRMLRRKRAVPTSYLTIDRARREAEAAVTPETVGRTT